MFWTYRSQRLLCFFQVSVLHLKALFKCIGKFWSLSKRHLGPSAFKRRTQCLAFCNRSARVAEKSCLSRAMRSVSVASFSPVLCAAADFRYPSCSSHLESIIGWLPCFGSLAFLSISFALKNMICLSGAPCFGPRLEFFSMKKSGIEVKSQFVFWIVVGTASSSKFSRNCNK